MRSHADLHALSRDEHLEDTISSREHRCAQENRFQYTDAKSRSLRPKIKAFFIVIQAIRPAWR